MRPVSLDMLSWKRGFDVVEQRCVTQDHLLSASSLKGNLRIVVVRLGDMERLCATPDVT